jgi:hypothetical protein
MTKLKTRLRALVGGIAATAIAGPALAQACLQPADQTAYEVRALQSHLMVVALACGRDQDYNAFVRKFQGDLAGAFRGVQAHFRRAGGNVDVYITQLANAHSQEQIRAGSMYCPLATPIFNVVMQQTNLQGLAALSQERNVINPVTHSACPATPASTGRRTTRS